MESNQSADYSGTLFVVAEEIANVLSEKQSELGVAEDAEARLRDSLAAATFARTAYLAILTAAEESVDARSNLIGARTACERTEQQLRRRVSKLIAEVSMLLDDDDLSDVAGYVLSVSR